MGFRTKSWGCRVTYSPIQLNPAAGLKASIARPGQGAEIAAFDPAAAHLEPAGSAKAAVLSSQMQLALLAGKPAEAIPFFRASHAAWEATGGKGRAPITKALLAEALALTGDIESALQLLDEAIVQIERPGWEERFFLAEILRLKGWMFSLWGDLDGAEQNFNASLGWHTASRRNHGSCAPRPASLGCGRARANARTRMNCSLRCTPRASMRRIRMRRRRCWTSWRNGDEPQICRWANRHVHARCGGNRRRPCPCDGNRHAPPAPGWRRVSVSHPSRYRWLSTPGSRESASADTWLTSVIALFCPPERSRPGAGGGLNARPEHRNQRPSRPGL
jgi:hypothetical protein